MKANEAPEKLYLHPDSSHPAGKRYLNLNKVSDHDIEYIRTDAFIEKALKWYCLDCECNDNCKFTKCFFYNTYKRYLEGDTNCLPPKLSNTILNEDGSTSDHRCYRHFITKMQDAFIEKARKWFEKQNEWFDPNSNRHCDMESFEDFRKTMGL